MNEWMNEWMKEWGHTNIKIQCKWFDHISCTKYIFPFFVLYWAKWLHSTKMWQTIRIHWECSHWGGGSFIYIWNPLSIPGFDYKDITINNIDNYQPCMLSLSEIHYFLEKSISDISLEIWNLLSSSDIFLIPHYGTYIWNLLCLQVIYF